MPDAERLLAEYDAQLREENEVLDASEWCRHGPLVWARFSGRGFTTYRALTGLDEAALSDLAPATIAHFAAMPAVTSVEWKSRGHDDTPGLDRVLRAAGFEPEERETVMIGEATGCAVEVAPPAEVRIVRAGDTAPGDRAALRAEVAAVLALQEEVFGPAPGVEVDKLTAELSDERGLTQLFYAVVDQGGSAQVVGAGRLGVIPGTDFAGLWGGSVLPAWRGRGVYRALVAARARAALALGSRYLYSDCTEYSRPILARSGLVPVTTTTPYVWTR